MRFIPRSLVATLIGLGLCGAVPLIHASDKAEASQPAKPQKKPPAAPASAQAQVEADAPSAGKKVPPPLLAEEDPMDKLREKLAKKLGAQAPAEKADPNVLRVVTRPAATSAALVAPATATLAPAAADDDHDHGTLTLAPRRAPKPAAKKAASSHKADHWSYEGAAGPDAWAQLKPEFATCSSGKRQSPIDIRDGIAVQLDPIRFDYKPSNFRVVDNGHTVQVNVAAGNSIEVMGKRFELQQFHFHRPSEERINSRQFDMVAHLVHKDLDGKLAVVAVLLDRGGAHSLVQTVWNNLPLEKNEELVAQVTLDLNNLLPQERGYFTYMGSLTTPPCSEGVLWMVMKQPVQVAPEQIAIFSKLYPMNARPLQAASGRLIKGSSN